MLEEFILTIAQLKNKHTLLQAVCLRMSHFILVLIQSLTLKITESIVLAYKSHADIV